MIPRCALATARRWDAHNKVVRNYKRVDGRRDDADRQRRQMAKLRRRRDRQGLDDDEYCDYGN